MESLRINKKDTICGAIIILQLLWMQTSILCPGLNGIVYQLIFYMKYIGTFFLLIYLLSKSIPNRKIIEYCKYLKLFVPMIVATLLIEGIAFITSPIITTYGSEYTSRFIAQILDKVCIFIMVGCIWIIKAEKTAEFMTNVFLIDEIILFIVKTLQVGIVSVIMPLFSGFGMNDAIESLLEVHEITYCLGFCLIYYLYFKPNKSKYDIIKVILMIVFILLGGKRIAILGILLSGVFCLFVHKKGLPKVALMVVGIGISAVGIIYLIMLYNGDFFSDLFSFNINSMGRDVIYKYFISRTHFGYDFFGYGISAVSKMIESWTRADVGNMVSVRGLHNDILKLYVDIGFWGLLCWLWFHYIYLPIKLSNKMGKKVATLYVSLAIYAFVTYMTDNTEGYFVFQVSLYTFPIGYYLSSGKIESFENKKLSTESNTY